METVVIHQVGGNLIGQGAYGCVFNPPLKCRGGKQAKPGMVGKLGSFKELKQEIVASTILSKKPEASKYFILPELSSLCKPAALEEQTEKDILKCKVLLDPDFSEKNMFQFSAPLGGIPLVKIAKHPDFKPGKIQFVAIMRHLLEAGAYLLLNGYVHNDIHSENVLLKPGELPRLIDWNRSFSYKQLTDEVVKSLIAAYAPYISQIPPENTTIDGIYEGVPLKRILFDMKTQKDSIIHAERYLGVPREKTIRDFERFWTTSKAAEKEDWLTLYKLYWPVNDSWMIGHVLLSMIRRLSPFREFVEGAEWVKNQGRIKEILRGLLRGSPRDRLDCLEALALFDPMNDLVTGESGSAWLERKQAQRDSGRAFLRGGGLSGDGGEAEWDESDDD